jgi:hypothetical protein
MVRRGRSRTLDGHPGQMGCPCELEANVSIGFADELGHRIIGVAVRCAGGFRFFSSDLAYRNLEDRIFPNLRAIARFAARPGVPA